MLKLISEVVKQLDNLGILIPAKTLIQISGSTLGLVYFIGRLLELVKTDHQKNVTAAIGLVIFSGMFVVNNYDHPLTGHKFYYLWLQYTCMSAIPYVLFAWPLYRVVSGFISKRWHLRKTRKK